MTKATGFMRYDRQSPLERDPLERTNDWIELTVHQPEATLKAQGARCMDCGVPFCHEGQELAGATTGCPINNLIPEWNDLVYRGLWQEAFERLDKTNNFPEFTGRVCPAPCEAACVLGINAPPVTIKSIENAIIDKAFDNGWVKPFVPAKRTGKKVAVIGSGPAGLAAADQLNKVGHQVTVFERDDRIGGLLMYGIPSMKLDKAVVQRRIDLMAASGIVFKPNVEVGTTISAESLQAEFDAIVLCTGATEPRDLPLPGRELSGIDFAMDYLRPNTKSWLDSQHADGAFLTAEGKHVVVIGGGDTGTDCVGTAVRHNCASVTQLEIMNRPPDERAADNPWPQWPHLYQLDYGQKEAKAHFGSDPRQYATLTKEFVGEDGRLVGLRVVDVVWEPSLNGNEGRPTLRELPDTERVIQADLVLLALGYTGPAQNLLAQFAVAQTDRNLVQANTSDYATSVDGVFAAGDARRGQSLVVWAIQEGRAAARAVDLYLMHATDLP